MCSKKFRKIQVWVYNFVKKEALAQVFSCKFCEIFKSTFSTEHLWMNASVISYKKLIVYIIPPLNGFFNYFFRRFNSFSIHRTNFVVSCEYDKIEAVHCSNNVET